jgi:putative ABC transport system substrate-binding protein
MLGAVVLGSQYLFFIHKKSTKSTLSMPEKMRYKVGIVRFELSDSSEKISQGVVQGIRQQADDVLIEYLHAGGDRIQLRAVIEKAVNEGVDVLVTLGSAATQLAKEVTLKRNKLIPIIFCGIGDPIKSGITSSFVDHGGHITGYCIAGFDFVRPMIEQLAVFAPRTKKILIPYDPTSLGGTLEEYRDYIGVELEKKGYQVFDVKIYHTNEVVAKVLPLIEQSDMVMVLPDITVLEAMEGLGKICGQHHKFSYAVMNLAHLERGAALAFGYDINELGFDAGLYVRRILNGERPQDLPVCSLQPSRFKIGINIQNARTQGLWEQVDQRLLSVMAHEAGVNLAAVSSVILPSTI